MSVSTGPDGSITRSRAERVNADGSSSVILLGAGGAGTREDTLAAGKAAYAVDSAGHHTTTQASVHGLDPVRVGAMAVRQKVVGAAHSLGSDSNWGMLWQQVQRDSLAGGVNRSYGDTLNNSLSSNWRRAFNDQSSFIHTLDEIQRTQLQGMLGAGGGIKSARIGANGNLSIVGGDGEQVNFNVSEDTARACARDEARVRSEAVAQTFSDGRGLDYLANVAKRIGATEAYSILDEAREINRAQESYGADLTTALIRNYARERYGEETPETIRKTISDFNSYVTRQGPAGVNTMQDIVSGFVSGHGYGWGSTGAEVQSAIQQAKGPDARPGDDEGVYRSGGRDRCQSYRLDQRGNLQGKEPHPVPMREPNGKQTVSDADSLRSVNRYEESGKGRIRTNAKGMAAEGVGKVFKGWWTARGNGRLRRAFLQPRQSECQGLRKLSPAL